VTKSKFNLSSWSMNGRAMPRLFQEYGSLLESFFLVELSLRLRAKNGSQSVMLLSAIEKPEGPHVHEEKTHRN
jgi:hypothetical protein